MYRYLYVSPRGFANEYSLYRVAPDEVSPAKSLVDRANDDPNYRAYWVTRKQAERIAAGARRRLRDQEAAGLNSYNNPVGATEIIDFGD